MKYSLIQSSIVDYTKCRYTTTGEIICSSSSNKKKNTQEKKETFLSSYNHNTQLFEESGKNDSNLYPNYRIGYNLDDLMPTGKKISECKEQEQIIEDFQNVPKKFNNMETLLNSNIPKYSSAVNCSQCSKK